MKLKILFPNGNLLIKLNEIIVKNRYKVRIGIDQKTTEIWQKELNVP